MFEGDSADNYAGKFLLVSMGGRAEGLACADPGARTPIGASGNLLKFTIGENNLKTNFLISGFVIFVYLLIPKKSSKLCKINKIARFWVSIS